MDSLYGKRLKSFRKKRRNRFTQIDLAEDLSVTPEYYSRLENGNKSPSLGLHIAICLALDAPSDCFFREDHENFVMTAEQRETLQSLNEDQLKSLLKVLQAIYED